jgi:hypothetical protein
MLNRSRVINTDSLAGSQWRCHSFASCVYDVRRSAQSETYRALLAPDDDRPARFIRRYGTSLVSCARSSFRCSCRSICCCGFFSRGGAGLCKRQWRSQPADQSNGCFLHSDASFLIRFTPQFVTHGSNGRYFPDVFGTRRFEWASQIR